MTSPFVVKTAYYESGGGGSWTINTETTALSFSITHEFNNPAEVQVQIQDNSGSIWQRFIGGGYAYICAGILYIEQPAATTIFKGRIVDITQNQMSGIITITAKDYMDQLDDDRIDYHMAEDLTGGGVYESTLHTDINNATYKGPVYTNAGVYYAYDDDMDWAADEWNGLKFMLLAGHAGPVTIYTGPYNETTATAGALDTDDPADGENNVWDDDANSHAMYDDDYQDWTVIYDFRVFGTEGTLYSSGPTGMRVNIVYRLRCRGTTEGLVHIYDHNTAAWIPIGNIESRPDAGYRHRIASLSIPAEYVPRGTAIDTDGVCHVKIEIQQHSDAATYLNIYKIEVETDMVASAHTSPITVNDTIDLNGHGGKVNCIEVATDLSITGLGLWETCPYAISKKISQHINTIVTGNDNWLTMTTSVEATSNYSTRFFEDFSPLRMLQELAEADNAVFWVTLGSAELTWKSTFTDAAPTAITDASVIAWHDGIFTMQELFNEFHVYGVRLGEHQVYDTATDATSVTKYRTTRAKVYKGLGMLSDAEAYNFADSAISKYSDPVYPTLTASLNGLSALRLGDEIRVTSTYHNLANTDYTIVSWGYDSDRDVTLILCQQSDSGIFGAVHTLQAQRNKQGEQGRMREESGAFQAPTDYRG